jgi:hypothetical protein
MNLKVGISLKEKNRFMMWGIFAPKKEEIIGVWRKLHNEEIHNLYF